MVIGKKRRKQKSAKELSDKVLEKCRVEIRAF